MASFVSLDTLVKMRVGVVLALTVCVAVTVVGAAPGRQRRLELMAKQLRANIAMVEQALSICEAELNSATDSPVQDETESADADSDNKRRVTM
ncbi:hypothetical protein ElyMa_005586200 [Elysia marginata]|uniref:Nematode cuticle collagen N-terminal domain-containing protein n=1 Tax=Elysia marginata TaxID=1093978 RepID=A0AAV4F2X7_9GAST|nr:hypothetical protein ElyMa_005586200 [Elysia marginata]